MHLAPLIQDLAVILGIGALAAFAFQRLRQPTVLGYLLAGIVLGPHTPPVSFVIDIPGIQVWAELGVIFLMFTLGLELSLKKLLKVGLSAAISGPFEVLVMLTIGFLTGRCLGWTNVDCIFLGAILSISSTTIIIKTLDELGLKQERFAQLAFGVLIVEDLVGILILVGLTSFADQGQLSGKELLISAAKLILIVMTWIVGGTLTVPRFVHYVAKRCTDETLTLLALGLCLGLVVLSAYFGYSPALGAFVMGSILAEGAEAHRIEKLLQPVRNVFAAVFFVSIGMLFDPQAFLENWWAVVVICIVTILGKVLSTSAAAKVTGQDKATALQLGFSLAQIGEFSFIIAGLGTTLGVMNPRLYSIAIAVSVVTCFTTPYLIRFSRTMTAARVKA